MRGVACLMVFCLHVLASRASAFVAFGCAVALLLIRKPDAILNSQFWGEDGKIFYLQSVTLGAKSIVTSYSGYFHLIPRSFALIYCNTFAALYLPALFNLTAIIVTALSCAWIAQSRLDVPARWLFAIVPLLMPQGGEVLANLTDLQWALAPILIVLCLQIPEGSAAEKAGDIAIAVAVGLTGPFSVFALPLFVVRFVCSGKNSYEIALFGAAAFAAGIQAFALFGATSINTNMPLMLAGIPHWLAVDALAQLFGTSLYPSALGKASRLGVAVASVSAIGILLGLPAAWRVKAIGMLAFAVCLLFASAAKYGDAALPIIAPLDLGQRYIYIPYAMAGWCLYVLATRAGRYWRPIGIVALVLCLASSARNFVALPMEDLHWRDHIVALRGGEGDVPINPSLTMHVFGKH
jgi:hypothetical protein